MNKTKALRALIRDIRLHRKYRDRTMIWRNRFVANLLLAEQAMNRTPPGSAVIECGTWRGGMSAALAEVGGRDRPYWFFDSFEGLPPPQPIDGKVALDWQKGVHGNNYDNCRASLDEFMATMAMTGMPPSAFNVRKGFFVDTFPELAPPPIAVLRLDGDWYSSTMESLEKFWPFVVPRGIVIVDDYDIFAGCTRAVHDYLSRIKATEAIRRSPIGDVTYLIKRAEAPPADVQPAKDP